MKKKYNKTSKEYTFTLDDQHMTLKKNRYDALMESGGTKLVNSYVTRLFETVRNHCQPKSTIIAQ